MNKPKTPEELYAFFIPQITKAPMKSHGYYLSGKQLNRSGWHLQLFRIENGETVSIWFYPHPARNPKWILACEKYDYSS